MWVKSEEFVEKIQREPWAMGLPVQEAFWPKLLQWVEEHVLHAFLTQVTDQVDEIIKIDPDLDEPRILALATWHMVEFLGAQSASVRIYDPQTEQMLSYGSYPYREEGRATYIPLEGSIAGEVVKSGRTYLASDLMREALYHDKEGVRRKGVNSLMAVPLEIPRFFPRERDTVGVIQIYYRTQERRFPPLEIEIAELMARRLSFVIARKKLMAMYRLNEKKETIVRKIFLRLGTREGIKMKDVFNRVIPELADIINLQSCALFSVTDDRDHVVLEAGYPEAQGYHGIGKRFVSASEPAFQLVLSMGDYVGESEYDVVTPSYVLVVDPLRSRLLSRNLKTFARDHNINSILYVPLSVGEEVNYFMTFDALEQRQRYTEEEIEVFLFLGRELMKAQQMERMDDILHDFKNPAIATAGFARRLKHLLKQGEREDLEEQIQRCVDILLEETSRLQELALSVYTVGKEQIVNMTERLIRRFEINKQAIKEQLKQNVTLQEGPFHAPLHVRCYPLHMERLFDNLLNNATNAIPSRGGTLAIRTSREGGWACAEITNTGRISEEERLRLLEGEGVGRGRGLHITYRIVRLLNGHVDVRVGRDTTTFTVRLPVFEDLNEEGRPSGSPGPLGPVRRGQGDGPDGGA
jgi:signal transduction histidine kinase